MEQTSLHKQEPISGAFRGLGGGGGCPSNDGACFLSPAFTQGCFVVTSYVLQTHRHAAARRHVAPLHLESCRRLRQRQAGCVDADCSGRQFTLSEADAFKDTAFCTNKNLWHSVSLSCFSFLVLSCITRQPRSDLSQRRTLSASDLNVKKQ